MSHACNVVQVITGENGSKKMKCERSNESTKIKGTVVLMKKNILTFKDPAAMVLDCFDEFIGRRVSLQLISSVVADHPGNPAYLEKWNGKMHSMKATDTNFAITFDWDEEMGVPGALTIRNNHHRELYLKTVTLEDVLCHGSVHFVCNSWIYPTEHYERDRVFFSNKTYLPHQLPAPLRKYIEEEFMNLRGTGKGELQESDRVYDYAFYNDLGDPDKGPEYARPILGGSTNHPYPRRARTGRAPAKSDPECESRLSPLKSLSIYVPRDEQFSPVKKSEFLFDSLQAIAQSIGPELEALVGKEFNCYDDVIALYEKERRLADGTPRPDNNNLLAKLEEFFHIGSATPFKLPTPHVIKAENKSAWMTDEEFAREMLAGLNPVNIRRLMEFPPTSKLNRKLYGDHNSTITEKHIKNQLNGLSIEQAIKKSKLFILDHHDSLMPYVGRINRDTSTKIYASRTILYLEDDSTLRPLAIELSLPHPEGEQFGAMSSVYTPAKHGVEGAIWQLAKAYVTVNDSGFHQLISHWLNTHAAIEPFVIATNRQLSVVHPVHKLLHPHFRDTLYINALARQILINAGGVLELTVFPAKYALEMSSAVYKNWVFTDQALPEDLKKRGMAVECENGLQLVIEDYPFAVDGLEIWSEIKTWVRDYCSFYYKSDDMVADDPELQSWWKEIRREGHGDLRDKPWWPDMQTRNELIETCTTIIWVASALHAAINFGQYPYGGYVPNRPTITRRLMPEKHSEQYKELELNPEKAFLKTITAKPQAILGITLIEILSRHSSEEVYLGEREPDWTSDEEPLQALEKFRNSLSEIGERIIARNNEEKWKNRKGPVNVPYTLLFPTSEVGITGMGIPNSISI